MTTPTLLIVGGLDTAVIQMNRDAMARMQGEVVLDIVPGATHLFKEPGGLPHQHHEEGNRFTLEIEISVSGERIVVSRDSNVHGLVKDLGAKKGAKAFEVEGMRKHLGLVIREAFDIARRQLRDYARRHRMAVKKHEGAPVRRARQAR